MKGRRADGSRLYACGLGWMVAAAGQGKPVLKSRAIARWLTPGLGVKRWLFILVIGIVTLSLGLGLFWLEMGFNHLSQVAPPAWLPQAWFRQFAPGWLQGLIVIGFGLGISAWGILELSRTFSGAYSSGGQIDPVDVAEREYQAHRRHCGPKVVAIGGGTGLSALLRGIKHHTDNITAIITVADDGGSSGKLRRSLGVLPPGDFRNCIAALADDEALITQLFKYRFPKYWSDRSRQQGGLEGHSFGNLFISTMAEVTGSFERALLESGKVLAIRGRILPSTLENVTLLADVAAEHGARQVAGESAIPKARWPIERVYLEPYEVKAYPGAVRAILEADLILIGPGSLYTSVLPNLLVEDITGALRSSYAPKIYICNVATQTGETDNYSVIDHVRALEKHIGPGVFSHVITNNNFGQLLSTDQRVAWVKFEPAQMNGYQLITADLIDEIKPWRHHPAKLAAAIFQWFERQPTRNG